MKEQWLLGEETIGKQRERVQGIRRRRREDEAEEREGRPGEGARNGERRRIEIRDGRSPGFSTKGRRKFSAAGFAI